MDERGHGDQCIEDKGLALEGLVWVERLEFSA